MHPMIDDNIPFHVNEKQIILSTYSCARLLTHPPIQIEFLKWNELGSLIPLKIQINRAEGCVIVQLWHTKQASSNTEQNWSDFFFFKICFL